MPKLNKTLPGIFDTDIHKFKQHNGKYYLSYSSYTSWKSDMYRGSWIASKYLGIPDNGNIFSSFGSACGEFIETDGKDVSEMLSPEDIAYLKTLPRPEGAEYERMVVIDRGWYIIYGYIDMSSISDSATVNVLDYKTGGEKKIKDYAGPDYNQTRLYAYGLEEEGEEVGDVSVLLLMRKGNNTSKGDKNVLRLEGSAKEIDTPYNRDETSEWLDKSFDKVATEISDFGRFLNKYFKDSLK